MSVNVEEVLYDKLSALMSALNNGEFISTGCSISYSLGSKYSGTVEVKEVEEDLTIGCKISLYRKPSGLLAHEIILVIKPRESDADLHYIGSKPYLRGKLIDGKSRGVTQRGTLEKGDFMRGINVMQVESEKLAFIKLLDKFGV
jgi:hypothetical protein